MLSLFGDYRTDQQQQLFVGLILLLNLFIVLLLFHKILMSLFELKHSRRAQGVGNMAGKH